MNEHDSFVNQIPEYAAGVLEGPQRRLLEDHLAGCAACRAELAFWMDTSAALKADTAPLQAPPFPAGLLLQQNPAVRHKLPRLMRRVWHLVRSQIGMVQKDIWPASAAVILVGYFFALISGETGVLRFFAPLVAAACISVIYGPDFDPALEVSLATPTSPWQILLARLTLVFIYNLALGLAASLALLPFFPQLILGELITAWLCPMAFLSALALMLSLPLGSQNAIATAYILWISQYLIRGAAGDALLMPYSFPAFERSLQLYLTFWNSPQILAVFSFLLVLAALCLIQIKEERFLHTV